MPVVLPETISLVRTVNSEHEPWYGNEIYWLEKLSEWVLAEAEILCRTSRRNSSIAIDFGGSSGYFAMQIAKKGLDVTVIDFIGNPEIIAERNRQLRADKSENGIISFHLADVRKLEPLDVSVMCNNKAPVIVTALRLIHFLKPDELSAFFDLLSQTLPEQAVFAACYATSGSSLMRDEDNTMYDHNPCDVALLARRSGFYLEYEGSDPLTGIQGFRRRSAEAPCL